MVSTNNNLTQNYYKYAISRTIYGEKPFEELVSLSQKIVNLNWMPYLEKIPKNAALDIGAGPGIFLHIWHKLGFQKVTGIDRSNDCTNSITSHNSESINIEYICDDAINFLKNTKTKYDLISAFHVIEHIPEDIIPHFLELCNQRLSENGILLIETPNMQYPLASYHRYGDSTHTTGFTPGSLKTLLLSAGFRNVYVGPKKNPSMSLLNKIRNILAYLYLNIIYKFLTLLLEGPTESRERLNIYSAYFWAIATKNKNL